MKFLHDEGVALQRAGDGSVERCFLRQGPQTEHVEVFLPEPRPAGLPFLQRLCPIQKALADLGRLLGQVFMDHFIAGLGLTGSQRRQKKQTEKRCVRHGVILRGASGKHRHKV